MDIRPIGASFAQEVLGLDLWKPPDAAAVEALRAAWAEAGVLVFRRQALSERELLAFSAAFGVPERIVRSDWASPSCPEVTNISNLKDAEGRAIGGLGAGELAWHTDQSYMAEPATGALLYAVELPAEGGATCWANLKLAWAALPEALKRRIEGRRAVFSYAKRQSGYQQQDRSAAVRPQTPDVTHALVNAHPATGERALYLDPGTMTGIAGLEPAEGEALLAELSAFATQDRFVYRHEWRPGDVVMWDNGFTLHRREWFDPAARRLLKRTTLALPRHRHIVPRGARMES
jgi:alpha-ketoglutarate-dependent taurine dioxygenase